MLILSRVCAEFHDIHGNTIFTVNPMTRNSFIEAPETIRQDPLFRMLLNDGSLEAAVPEERKKILEQDPTAGHDAEGKAIRIEPDEQEVPAEENASEKGDGKSDPKAGDKPAKAGRQSKADKPATEPAKD